MHKKLTAIFAFFTLLLGMLPSQPVTAAPAPQGITYWWEDWGETSVEVAKGQATQDSTHIVVPWSPDNSIALFVAVNTRLCIGCTAGWVNNRVKWSNGQVSGGSEQSNVTWSIGYWTTYHDEGQVRTRQQERFPGSVNSGVNVFDYTGNTEFWMNVEAPACTESCTQRGTTHVWILRYSVPPTSTPTVTPTSTSTVTLTPTPVIGEVGNVLRDGDMEEQPNSRYWFPNQSAGHYGTFGRLDTSNPDTNRIFGSARCDKGMQLVGNFSCPYVYTGDPVWDEVTRGRCLFLYSSMNQFSSIKQQFDWPGGTMYYRFSTRGIPDSGWDRNININMWINGITTPAITSIFNAPIPPTWIDHNGQGPTLAAGTYMLYIDLALGNAPGDSFLVDDIVIDNAPIDEPACQQVIPATTLTPTPTPPPGYPGPDLLNNCGFELGETYWNFRPGYSYVVFSSANNYAHIEHNSPDPGISQYFSWPGGTLYATWQSDSNYRVYLSNVNNGLLYTLGEDENPWLGWQNFRGTAPNLPAGTYKINLQFPTNNGPARYDNIAVSQGNYSYCTAGSNTEPTEIPTATPNQTATPFPTSTQRPTSTVPVGQYTSTPQPTYTPYPTYTPAPTQVTATPRNTVTPTIYPTYTSYPTFTPFPSYTPNAQGTIEPSPTPPPGLPTGAPPQEPPPAYDADCKRPNNGYDIAWWIEYNRCISLSFFSMSPNAVKTAVAIPTLFQNSEPFGTLGDLTGTVKDIQGLINSYDWDNQGLPGTGDAPSVNMILTPGANNPWDGQGNFDFGPGTPDPGVTTCDAKITGILGGAAAQGICYLFNMLNKLGVMSWIQLLLDLTAIVFFFGYIWAKWIDAGVGGG